MIGISGFPIWSKTLMELIFNPCCEFLRSPKAQLAKSSLLTSPVIFSDLLRSVQMLKREWGAESNVKLPHLLIPSKAATLVLEFELEDLSLGRIVVLVAEFSVKDLPLGRTL